MNPTKRSAHIAGALYLLASVPAVFSLLYVPSKLIVPGDPAASGSKILADELLFRSGMIAEILASIGFIFVARALYRLLCGVSKSQASLMVTLFVLSVPISFLNVLNDVAALALFKGDHYLAAFDKQQLDALAMLFLRLHDRGVDLAAIFWGLWLLPLGILVFRSRFLPRILGVFLVIGCFGYLASSFASLLLPDFAPMINQYAPTAEGLGELPIMAWLLIRGINVRRLPQTVQESASGP